MHIGPILAQLRRNPLGAVLIALQMAVTLAILCNAVFVAGQKLARSSRDSGVDEQRVFALHNEWLHPRTDGPAHLAADLATLRRLPGVVDAYASNTYPMGNWGLTQSVSLTPHTRAPGGKAAIYHADEHTLATLGLKLIAGRNFTPGDVTAVNPDEGGGAAPQVAAILITRALAETLAAGGALTGRTVYLGDAPATVIGVVERLQIPWTWIDDWDGSSMLWPVAPAGRNAEYLVRVQPGQLERVMASAQAALYNIDRARIVSNVRSMTDIRTDGYRDQRGYAVALAGVCAVMLMITASGIVGLTSYWVTQRRRQIGIRRALGGTRSAIVGHFQTENLLIALAGTFLGAGLALGFNLLAVQDLEMPRLPVAYVIISAATLIVMGQLAALWPALRAASQPPALAARSG